MALYPLHRLASASVDIMKKGGNAFDAIVATGFTLAVTSHQTVILVEVDLWLPEL